MIKIPSNEIRYWVQTFTSVSSFQCYCWGSTGTGKGLWRGVGKEMVAKTCLKAMTQVGCLMSWERDEHRIKKFNLFQLFYDIFLRFFQSFSRLFCYLFSTYLSYFKSAFQGGVNRAKLARWYSIFQASRRACFLGSWHQQDMTSPLYVSSHFWMFTM